MTQNLVESAVIVREAQSDELPRASFIAAGSLDLEPEDASEVPTYLWTEEPATHRVRLLASLEGEDVGVVLGSVQDDSAYLDLIAVLPNARRRGVGAALLTAWEAAAASRGASLLGIGENLHAYAWPGVDIRYTAAICLFRRAGYERTRIVYNMDLPLHERLAPDERRLGRLAEAGVEVRRAEPSDRDALAAHVRELWTELWAREVLIALEKSPATVFVGARGAEILGFAAHGVYRPSLYGPIATNPHEQGNGLGDVLSRLCLVDMLAHGVRTAQIGWVAEEAIPFYSRTVGARLGRCFWMMRKVPETVAGEAQ